MDAFLSNVYECLSIVAHWTPSNSVLDLRKHFFSQRIVDHWNKLPDDVVSAATISSFKKSLDIWMERYEH